jgi:predicted esterase
MNITLLYTIANTTPDNFKIYHAGVPLEQANKVLICVHGRGGSARDILGLAAELNLEGFALVAPEAPNNSWYPHSFLADKKQNEPDLDDALDMISDLRELLEEKGKISLERTALFGFSQGACLALEYAAKQGGRFGAVVALSGGLIGKALEPEDYFGELAGTPILIGCGDQDGHIPLSRVRESQTLFEKWGATLEVQIYPGMGHGIVEAEMLSARAMFSKI